MRRTFTLAALVAVAAALAAPVAFGDVSNGTSVKGYGGQASVQDQIDQPISEVKGVTEVKSAQATITKSGSLPFTGVDVALLAIGGIVLVGVGFAMRRGSRDVA